MLFTLSNPKTQKGESLGYLTAVLHLAPANSAGLGTVCERSTKQCRATCLYFAGRGVMAPVQAARVRRTQQFFRDPDGFAELLAAEVHSLVGTATRKGLKLAVRVNGTSDLHALALQVQARCDHLPVIFYDYTKILPDRYQTPQIHYTFSRSESNEADCRRALRRGTNVAVVFSTKKGTPLPAEYLGTRVIDGDAHDLRFLDPVGVVVGLRAKGRARRLTGGFVVQV